MANEDPADIDRVAYLLEAAERPLPRAQANRLAAELAGPLGIDAGGMISLMLCLQGDFRHASILIEKVRPPGEMWGVKPAADIRAAIYRAQVGVATAKGAVPALAVLAALLRVISGEA